MTSADDTSGSGKGSPSRVSLALMTSPVVVRMLFLGFSAGLPLMLVFSTLSVWLREAGIDRATVTLLSWAALAYSFKFVWAPLVDRLRLPLLGRLGRRRGWLLLAQMMIVVSLLGMAAFDPAQSLVPVAVGAVILGFASATQDIVIDAYRIEAAEPEKQSMMSAMYVAGYRLAMLVSGAGALWLASALEPVGTYAPDAWAWVYRAMAAGMAVGLVTTLVMPEPLREDGPPASVGEQLRVLAVVGLAAAAFLASFVALAGVWSGFWGEVARFVLSTAAAGGAALALVALGLASKRHVAETYVAPIADFFARHGRLAVLILALIGSYRVADIVMGAIATVFYVDMGFTKDQIATYTKVWGLAATLLGGFVGGLSALRLGVMTSLFVGAVLSAATNVVFAVLATRPGDTTLLLGAIVADNLAAGLAGAAFVAYLSALTSVRFTAMQYALFSSLMTLGPKILAGYGGAVVDAQGYGPFFIGTAVLGVPVLGLVWLAARLAPPGGRVS